MAIWNYVSELLKSKPLVSRTLTGTTTMHIERYFINTRQVEIPPLPITGLIVHLGGGVVTEGKPLENSNCYIPSQALVLPCHRISEWNFAGAADVALFYLLNQEDPQTKRLQNFISKNEELIGFSNPLIHSLAQTIVDNLKEGSKADLEYIDKLKELLIEEVCRLFETKLFSNNFTDFQQLGRISTAIKWMEDNLNKKFEIEGVAKLLKISEPHFRKIFNDEIGMSPNRYLMHLRLEQVRNLLTNTNWPIAKIAEHSNFKTQSHLTMCFKKAYGVTPSKVRAKSHRTKINHVPN